MKKSELRKVIKEVISSSLNEKDSILDMTGIMETELQTTIDSLEQVYNTIVAGYDLDTRDQMRLKKEIHF